MKNKQKMWRRPEVQAKYRKEAVAAAKRLAELSEEPKTQRFFMERVVNLAVIRIGRMVKENFANMQRVF